MMKLITVTLALLFSGSVALAQGTILQGGPWAPGHAPMYTGQGSGQAVVQDSGPAGGGGTGYGLSEQLLVARGTGTPPYVGQGTGPFGTNWCDYDAPITNPTGYHFFCISPNASGGGLLAYGAGGAASQLPLQLNLNGILYQFPFSTGGVVGPATSVVNDLPCWNNTTGTLLKDCGIYVAPAGALNLYASATGNDTNNNCTNSGTPCTLPGVCRERSQIATYLTTSMTINVADGTYSVGDVVNNICSIFGNAGGSSTALTNVVGNCGSPSNVVLNALDNHIGIFTKDAGEVLVKCLQINLGNNSIGISGAQFSIVDYTTIVWGTVASGGVHIRMSQGASANCDGGETILAGVGIHWSISDGSHLSAPSGCVTTIPTAVAWGSEFLSATNPASINIAGWTAAGGGVAGTTGVKAVLQGPGFLATGTTPCSSFLNVGSSGCLLTLGFQDDAGDPQTSPGPMATTIFASLPTPVAGMYAYISDGKAANCGDTSCTTFGTPVTGGGGALPLFIWYTGAAWHLSGK